MTVTYRKRNPRESAQIYKSKPLICEQVAIHRLHRLDLADEVVPGEVDVAAGGPLGQTDDSVDEVLGQVEENGGVLGHDVGQVGEGGAGVLVHDAGLADEAG